MAAGLDDAGAGAPQGLSWSWELDFGALARCIGDDGSAESRFTGVPFPVGRLTELLARRRKA